VKGEAWVVKRIVKLVEHKEEGWMGENSIN